MFQLGGDRVGVVIEVDTDEQTELLEPIPSVPRVAWVDGCLFEIQTQAIGSSSAVEQNSFTTTTSEVAFCYMPVVDGVVPAVDDDGATFQPPITAAGITSSGVLRHGHDYQMRGDAVLEKDGRGRAQHVFALCERNKG